MMNNLLHIAIAWSILISDAVDVNSLEAVSKRCADPLLSDKMLFPTSYEVQDMIVGYHNNIRSHVSPPASNMLEITWSTSAAKFAQKVADECLIERHDNQSNLYNPSEGLCGQIHSAYFTKFSWNTIIKKWAEDKKFYEYDNITNDGKFAGPYTQMIWAATHKVGCAFTRCDKIGGRISATFYNYICNYCPRGNLQYKQPYMKGDWCSSCSKHCKNGTLCTNPCPHINVSNRCDEVFQWRPNMCSREEYQSSCRATCSCHALGQIYYEESFA